MEDDVVYTTCDVINGAMFLETERSFYSPYKSDRVAIRLYIFTYRIVYINNERACGQLALLRISRSQALLSEEL